MCFFLVFLYYPFIIFSFPFICFTNPHLHSKVFGIHLIKVELCVCVWVCVYVYVCMYNYPHTLYGIVHLILTGFVGFALSVFH